MNENHRIEIEELLNALLDGQATDRQETEFKRLAKHDRTVLEQLEAMRRQKQLLGALPIESAPNALADEVRSMLERKLILGDFPEDKQTIAGTSHLYIRRILTTAAMLLLPLGLLSFVVYEIMKPASVGPAIYVSADETLAHEGLDNLANASSELDEELPFNGILTFRTDRQTAVSSYIEKMVFDQRMINFTVPSRTADAATYQITAPPEKITVLVESLGRVWSHCQDVSLHVATDSGSNAIQIPQVQAEQVSVLVIEGSRKMLDHLARQYATANIGKDSQFAKDSSAGPLDIGLDGAPQLAMPILTGRNEPAKQFAPTTQPTVQLKIHVERSAK